MPIARESLLLEILSQPTAPFRERHVIAVVLRELRVAGVPHFTDPAGNLVIGARSAAEYRKLLSRRQGAPLRLFIAHMDHPGFHGAEWSAEKSDGGVLQARWLGGSPLEHIDGASVWIASHEGPLGEGKVRSSELLKSGRALSSLVIDVSRNVRERHADASGIYGGFSFRAPVWKDGELLRTKAADDLVGAFAILSLALDHWAPSKARAKQRSKKQDEPPFLGLLTRAEEVGFIGAIGHFEQGWLPKARRQVLCVSLETSRQLPGAEIGKGPVVRLGDRYTVFHPGSLRVFTELAAVALPGRHQRRIMDGGTCEATAATAYGMDAVGISVPLGNYHNQSFEGGPDSRGENGPAPEFVHLEDVAGLLTLCDALIRPVPKSAATAGWDAPWKLKLKDFKKSLREHRALLRSGP